MAVIEKNTGREVGVVHQDRYWLWINDACCFTNGSKGVYGRILWRKSLQGTPGVVVIPISSKGKIMLNCNFRHATRSWGIELPRDNVNPDEELEAAAKREAAEETGMLVSDLLLFGNMPPDTGLTNSIIPIYMAKVVGKEEAQPEDSEAIEEILSLTITEVKQVFIKGYYEQKIRGVIKQIFFRDPFLAYALLKYELKVCHE